MFPIKDGRSPDFLEDARTRKETELLIHLITVLLAPNPPDFLAPLRWQVVRVKRVKAHLPLLDVHVFVLAVFNDLQAHVPLQLVEQLQTGNGP